MWKITLSLAAMIAISLSAQAQQPSWSEAQMDVWKVVEASWVDDAEETGKWPAEYVHDKYVTWGADSAGPVYKDASIKWSRFGDEANTTLIYEISPAAITVEGSTAVVHYYATTVSENHKGDREREVVRIAETLVKSGNTWKFLAGSSFEADLD